MTTIENTTNHIKSFLNSRNSSNLLINLFEQNLDEISKNYIKKSRTTEEQELYTKFLKEIEDLRSFIFNIQDNNITVKKRIIPFDYLDVNTNFDDYLSLISTSKNNRQILTNTYGNYNIPDTIDANIQFYITFLDQQIAKARQIYDNFNNEEQRFIERVIEDGTNTSIPRSIEYITCETSIKTSIPLINNVVFNQQSTATPDLTQTRMALKIHKGGYLNFFNENYTARLKEEELNKLLNKIKEKIDGINNLNDLLEKSILYNIELQQYSVISFDSFDYFYQKLLNNKFTIYLDFYQKYFYKIAKLIFDKIYNKIKTNKKCIKLIYKSDGFYFFSIFTSYFLPLLDI